MSAIVDRYRRANLLGLLLVITGLLLGAAMLGVDDRWSFKIAGFGLVALAIVLVVLRRPGAATSAFWTIAFLVGDREARSPVDAGRRLTLVALAIGAGGFAVTHVWMSSNWMAQTGLSIASLGGGR